ncbi:MAG: ABC transporter permease subunit [Eubacteriales bacterium]|nr:ABC transporter permease subunit [Eubacteriales bacterium]
MKKNSSKAFKGRASSLPLHLMLLVPVILTIIYKYGPMMGLVMAFEDYIPSKKGFFFSLFKSSTWVGLDWFKYIFQMPDFSMIVRNTIVIALGKLIAKIVVPLIFALLLNEVIHNKFKRIVQSITFIPYFLSWVILGSILLQIFSPRTGVFTQLLEFFGVHDFYLFGTPSLFQPALIVSDLWKEIGYNTIIFLAALTSIDPGLYEAAAIDGAGRFKQVLYISIPSLMGMVLLLTLLGIGSIMSAGFDQVYMLYSPAVYSTGDIIDTYSFRMGIQGGQYSLAAAVGLFKSVVSFILMVIANFMTSKLGNRSIL